MWNKVKIEGHFVKFYATLFVTVEKKLFLLFQIYTFDQKK